MFILPRTASQSRLGLVNLNFEEKAKSYRNLSIVAAVLVHLLAPVTGFALLVLLKRSFVAFLAVHFTLQAVTCLNAWYGPRLYMDYHKRRARFTVVRGAGLETLPQPGNRT